VPFRRLIRSEGKSELLLWTVERLDASVVVVAVEVV
jgi:hypothetical protein